MDTEAKTIAISECEPDVSALENLLLEKASHVLVKLSPMLDLTLALHDLKHVQAAPRRFRQQRMQGTSPCIRAREGIST